MQQHLCDSNTESESIPCTMRDSVRVLSTSIAEIENVKGSSSGFAVSAHDETLSMTLPCMDKAHTASPPPTQIKDSELHTRIETKDTLATVQSSVNQQNLQEKTDCNDQNEESACYLRREDKMKLLDQHPAIIRFSKDGRNVLCKCGRDVRLNPPYYILKFEQHLASRNCTFLRKTKRKRKLSDDAQDASSICAERLGQDTTQWDTCVPYKLMATDAILELLEAKKMPFVPYNKAKSLMERQEILRETSIQYIKDRKALMKRLTPDGKFVECSCGHLILLSANWSFSKFEQHWQKKSNDRNAFSLLQSCNVQQSEQRPKLTKYKQLQHSTRNGRVKHLNVNDTSVKSMEAARTPMLQKRYLLHQARDFHWWSLDMHSIGPCPGLRNERNKKYISSSFQTTGGSRPKQRIARDLFPELFSSAEDQLHKIDRIFSRSQKLLLHDAVEAEALWYIDKDGMTIRSLECLGMLCLAKGETVCESCHKLESHPVFRATIASHAKKQNSAANARTKKRTESIQICAWLELEFELNQEYGRLLRDLFLIDIEDGSALNTWIDLAEMGIEGVFDSHPAMIGLVESMEKLKDKKRRKVGMQNMNYSNLLDKCMLSLERISAEACEFFQSHFCGRRQNIDDAKQFASISSLVQAMEHPPESYEVLDKQPLAHHELLYSIDSSTVPKGEAFPDVNEMTAVPNLSLHDMPRADFSTFHSVDSTASALLQEADTLRSIDSVLEFDHACYFPNNAEAETDCVSDSLDAAYYLNLENEYAITDHKAPFSWSTSNQSLAVASNECVANLARLPCSGLRGDKVDNYITQAIQIIGGSRPKYVIAKELFPRAFGTDQKIRIRLLSDEQKLILSDAVFGECLWRVDKRGKCVRSLYCLRFVVMQRDHHTFKGQRTAPHSDNADFMVSVCRACKDLKSSANFRSVLSRSKVAKTLENIKFLPSLYTESDPFLRKLSKNASFRALYQALRTNISKGSDERKKRITFWLRVATMGLFGQFRSHPVFEALMESMVAMKDKERRGVGKQNMRYAKPLDDFLNELAAISVEAFEFFSMEFCGRTSRSQKILQRQKLDYLLHVTNSHSEATESTFSSQALPSHDDLLITSEKPSAGDSRLTTAQDALQNKFISTDMHAPYLSNISAGDNNNEAMTNTCMEDTQRFFNRVLETVPLHDAEEHLVTFDSHCPSKYMAGNFDDAHSVLVNTVSPNSTENHSNLDKSDPTSFINENLCV